MSVPPRHLLLVSLATALALAVPAQAQRQPPATADRGGQASSGGPQGERSEGQERRQSRRQDSMSDSIRHVRRTNRGQILSAERMHSNGREINRIKMVDDRGRVRVFEDDPQRRRQQRSRGDDG